MDSKKFSSDELDLLDKDWREEVKKETGEHLENNEDTVEYYSNMVKDWIVNNPVGIVGDWKNSFKDYCQERKTSSEQFLQDQYERYQETKESAKEKAANMVGSLENKAADRLEQWAKSLKTTTEPPSGEGGMAHRAAEEAMDPTTDIGITMQLSD